MLRVIYVIISNRSLIETIRLKKRLYAWGIGLEAELLMDIVGDTLWGGGKFHSWLWGCGRKNNEPPLTHQTTHVHDESG